MSNLEFGFDWMGADGVAGPELRATWASLRIQAGGTPISRIFDRRSRTVREEIFVPIYPLAEWLATNWWFLTREFENPIKERDPGFLRRHTLGVGMDGYAFPTLRITPSGARTRLDWQPGRSRWAGVDFLAGGSLWVDSGAFRETCADLIDGTVRRLDAFDIEGTLLQEEWAAIQAADRAEADFCEAAAGLGWDPYAIAEDDRALVLDLAGRLDGMPLGEAVAALDGRNPAAGCAAISRAARRARECGLALRRVGSVRSRVLEAADPEEGDPWSVGYELARAFRSALDLDGAPLPTMARVADAVGESPESLEAAARPVDFSGADLVDGVVVRDDENYPAFALRTFGENGRKFLFCRALAQVLVSPDSHALLTRARSEQQQRNRAFAAEFLAPSAALRNKVSVASVDGEDMDELAREFGVSPFVIAHQIENHDIAAISSETGLRP